MPAAPLMPALPPAMTQTDACVKSSTEASTDAYAYAIVHTTIVLRSSGVHFELSDLGLAALFSMLSAATL